MAEVPPRTPSPEDIPGLSVGVRQRIRSITKGIDEAESLISSGDTDNQELRRIAGNLMGRIGSLRAQGEFLEDEQKELLHTVLKRLESRVHTLRTSVEEKFSSTERLQELEGRFGKIEAGQKNAYEIIGVSPDASLADIKKRGKALQAEHHPDRGGDPDQAALLNAALAIIKNEEKRREYDEYLTLLRGESTAGLIRKERLRKTEEVFKPKSLMIEDMREEAVPQDEAPTTPTERAETDDTLRPDSPTDTPTRPPETAEARKMTAEDLGLAPQESRAHGPRVMEAGDLGLTPEQIATAERVATEAIAGAEAASQELARTATPEERNMLRGLAGWWRRQSTWKKIGIGVLLGVGGAGAYMAGGWAGHAAAALLYGTSRGLSFLSGFATVDTLTERMHNRYGAGALSVAGGVAMAFAIPSLVNFLNSEFGVGDKIGRWLGFSGESAGTGKPPVDPGAKGPGVTPEKTPGAPSHPVSVQPGDGPSTLIERALYAQGMEKADVQKLVYELQGKLIKVHDAPQGLKWEIVASPEKLKEWGIDPAVFEDLKTDAWKTSGKTLDLTRMLQDPSVRAFLPKDVALPDITPEVKTPDTGAPEKGPAVVEKGIRGEGTGISAQVAGAPLEGAVQPDGSNPPHIPEGSAEGTVTEAQRAALERQREILTFENFRSGVREAFGRGGFLSFLFGGDSGVRLFNLHDWRTASEFINATTLPNITARALHTAQEYLSENARALGINLDGLTVRRAIEAIAEGKAGKEL